MAYPERIIPDDAPPGPVALHERRYRFALPYCERKDVLDAACGVGYGTEILAEVAEHVTGLDLSEEAIAYARGRYARENAEFVAADLLEPPLADGTFDAVVSFETIEHVRDRDAYLRQVVRLLRSDGVYLVSTPQAARTTETPENPYHFVEYDQADFEALLGRYFDDVELYGQRRVETRRHRALRRLDVLGLRRRVGFLRRAGSVATGTAPTESVALDDVVIARDGIERATELVAVCRLPRRR